MPQSRAEILQSMQALSPDEKDEGKVAGSCQNACGSLDLDESCWCDNICMYFEDCCEDVLQACPDQPQVEPSDDEDDEETEEEDDTQEPSEDEDDDEQTEEPTEDDPTVDVEDDEEETEEGEESTEDVDDHESAEPTEDEDTQAPSNAASQG